MAATLVMTLQAVAPYQEAITVGLRGEAIFCLPLFLQPEVAPSRPSVHAEQGEAPLQMEHLKSMSHAMTLLRAHLVQRLLVYHVFTKRGSI